MSTKHYSHPKSVRGPGGLKCYCCRFESLAKTKRRNSRLVRRKARQALAAESFA